MENDVFKIDKGVPVPPADNKPTMSETAKAMEVGDSIGGLTDKQAKSLSQALRNQGFAQTTRKEKEGFRVWKQAAQTTDK